VPSRSTFSVWGLSASLVTTEADAHAEALDITQHILEDMTRAASRFLDDSELTALNAAEGPFTLSPLLRQVYDAAFAAWRMTDGACDPTVHAALLASGYDTDFDALPTDASRPLHSTPSPGLGGVSLDEATNVLRRPDGVTFDFGATAKALTCDLIADAVAPLSGVCIELGGDVAVRGPAPEGLWAIGVATSLPLTGNEPRVGLHHGAVATSSSGLRSWQLNGQRMHHLIDPRTGAPSTSPFLAASVSAADCVTANAFATACVVWGDEALHRVIQSGWSARVVTIEGDVLTVGGWPEDTK